eukprot:824072-Amphidinium_carterae.4
MDAQEEDEARRGDKRSAEFVVGLESDEQRAGMPSASSGTSRANENDEETKRRWFQEQRSNIDREETSASLAGKRAREDEDEERIMDTLAFNMSRLGGGSLWHIHGALDGWTEARNETLTHGISWGRN